MCDYCGRYPCHHNCPNAKDAALTYICDHCGRRVYDDTYYDINGEKWCVECVDKCWKVILDEQSV